MNPFNFLGNVHNQMLINPRSPENEKKDQYFLKQQFEEVYGDKNYFLVPSSGSSADEASSVKLIALHQDAVLNSAARVNNYFNLTKLGTKLNFGCVLPTFHVGGLGLYARAFLLRSPVYQSVWEPAVFQSWIIENQINILSLVPAQIFDFVQRKIKAPDTLQVVFVGGSKLAAPLRLQCKELGWNLTESYGMTETCSMIAVGADEFKVFPDIEVALNQDRLKIKCDSLMTCSIQIVNETVEMKTLDQGWLLTDDKAQIRTEGETTLLKISGRSSDYIKINSEGVSLASLRNTFGEDPSMALFAVAHERSEFEVVLAYENTIDVAKIKEKVQLYNQQVRPFEKIKKVFPVEKIPKTELQKVKYKALQELIKGKKYENL